jgi:hypothetical protein
MSYSILNHVSLPFPMPRGRACIAVVNGAFQEILYALVQLKSDLTKMFLSSSFDFLQSSKHLAFRSLHMVHIKHNGAILHTARTE